MRDKIICSGDKSSRRGESSGDDDVVDRISNLPEPIISLILSLLPTNTAVKTSVLSTRWRYLWTTVFNLDFSNIDYVHIRESEYQRRSIQFVQFVDWVLLHQRAGYINKFSLEWYSRFVNSSSIHDWLNTSISRHVQELCVEVQKDAVGYELIEMPLRNIFRAEKLVSLELNCRIFFPEGMDISLPRIERLKLVRVQFEYPEDFQQLITGCSILKYLYVELDVISSDFEYEVSSTSLIHFNLSLRAGGELTVGQHSLVLEVPSLEVLELNGMIYWIYIEGTLGSLVQAYLRLPDYWEYTDWEWDDDYCNSIVLAIRSLCSAQTLFLSAHLVSALTFATIRLCTKFDRLKELHVGVSWHTYNVSVVDFIQWSDNLQILRVMLEPFDGSYMLPNLPRWRNPEDVPVCLSKSLKTVSLDMDNLAVSLRMDGYYEYKGLKEGFEMVDYILQNGAVMEVMEMDVHKAPQDQQLKVVRDVCEVPRKSPACKVKFSLLKKKKYKFSL